VNCAAIPENLLESELFGHEKGAFTGAVSRRVGKFEEADCGTLLLDEISEMHPRLQAKLLRAIQEREIDRVGSNHPIKVDFRLLATSNRALEEDVRKGNFRKDLYFRLNVINIALPALRDRPLDIEILAAFFLKKYAESNAVARPTLSSAALELLLSHHWRGNVRELENTMHRAVLLTQDDVIEPTNILLTGQSLAPEGDCPGAPDATGMANDFPLAADSGTFVRRTVAVMERDLIIDTLQHCFGNRTHAANILGISIRTLRNKLKLYSLAGAAIPLPGEGERQQAQ
jgi:two-component system response regulator FlrC